MPEREVDPDTAAALDLLDAVAAFTGEPPAVLLRRVLVGALAHGVGATRRAAPAPAPVVAGVTLAPPRQIKPDVAAPAPHGIPTGPLPVFLIYQGERAEGRFWPETLWLAIDAGPESTVGVSYGSPSKAARAVIAGWKPGRNTPTNGWLAWRLVGSGLRLDTLRPRRPSPQEPHRASA